jgi:hypothetical protein
VYQVLQACLPSLPGPARTSEARRRPGPRARKQRKWKYPRVYLTCAEVPGFGLLLRPSGGLDWGHAVPLEARAGRAARTRGEGSQTASSKAASPPFLPFAKARRPARLPVIDPRPTLVLPSARARYPDPPGGPPPPRNSARVRVPSKRDVSRDLRGSWFGGPLARLVSWVLHSCGLAGSSLGASARPLRRAEPRRVGSGVVSSLAVSSAKPYPRGFRPFGSPGLGPLRALGWGARLTAVRQLERRDPGCRGSYGELR